MFKWAAKEGLIEPSIFGNLRCVDGLKEGRSIAPETEPVKPVPEHLLSPVVDLAPTHIAAMINLQRLTGMRPGEVTILRTCDLDTTGTVWTYRPWTHKTEHRKRERIVFIGPKAQIVSHGARSYCLTSE